MNTASIFVITIAVVLLLIKIWIEFEGEKNNADNGTNSSKSLTSWFKKRWQGSIIQTRWDGLEGKDWLEKLRLGEQVKHPRTITIVAAILTHILLKDWTWYQNLAKGDGLVFWTVWITLVGLSTYWKKGIVPVLCGLALVGKIILTCFPNLDTSSLTALVERQGTPSQQEVESPPPKVKKVFTTAGDWTFVEIPRSWQHRKLHWRITTNFTSYEVRTSGNKVYTFDPRVAAVMPTVGQRFLEFKTPESGIIWLSDHPITDSELDE
jgi:hypothetical protein